ncbi:MAG: arginine N-succinyltransferase [Candidatus Marinamargulisbacteria bacterium]
MPPMSIFVDLLPADVQAVIGRCHLNSVPALKLLMKEGFSFTDTIDVVDGGPRVMAELSEIDTVKHARCATYKKLDDHFVLSPDLYMVGNMQLPVYKACCTKILISDEGEVSLPPDVARRLGIPVGLEFYYDELFTQRSMDIAVAELNDQQSKPFLRRVAEWYKTASISSKIRG